MRILNEYRSPVTVLAVSADGTQFYTAADGQAPVWIWDVATGNVLAKLNLARRGDKVMALACSPRPQGLCCSVTNMGLVMVWKPDGADVTQLTSRVFYHAAPHTQALAFHPNGTRLAAVVTRDRRTTELYTWELPHFTPGVNGKSVSEVVLALTYSPDGKQLLAASADGFARLLDAVDGKELRLFYHEVPPGSVSFRPDGQEFATGHGWKVSVWSMADGNRRSLLKEHSGPVGGVAYSPDGLYLASVARDGAVILRDANTLKQVGLCNLGIGKLYALAWLPDGRLVVGGEGPIAICERAELLVKQKPRRAGEGGPLSLAGHNRRIQCLSYSPDGKVLASFSQFRLILWDMSAGAGNARPLHQAEVRHKWLDTLWWLPEGYFGWLESDILYFLSPQTFQPLRQMKCGEWVFHVGVGPEGQVVQIHQSPPSAQQKHWLELFTAEGTRVAALPRPTGDLLSPGVRVAAVMKNAEQVYIHDEKQVYRWSVAEGKLEPLAPHSAKLSGVAFRSDARCLATMAGYSIQLWSLPDGERFRELRHPHMVTGVAFLSGGRVLTSCLDKLVRVWAMASGKELLTLDPGMGKLWGLKVAPDEMTFAVGAEKSNRIVLMDVPD